MTTYTIEVVFPGSADFGTITTTYCDAVAFARAIAAAGADVVRLSLPSFDDFVVFEA